jgi:hypothetical protein
VSSIYRHTLSVQNIKETFLILSCTPFCPQNNLSLLGHGLYKLLKAFHRDTSPCWLQSIIKRCSGFLTILSTRQILQALGLSHLDYCSVVWSAATKRDLGKYQLAQNMAAWLALKSTQRANINDVHVNLSWLKVEERLTCWLFVFVRGVNKLTPMHTPQDMPPEVGTLFRVSKTRTVLHRAMTTWNSIPHQVTDASSTIRFKTQGEKIPYGTVKRRTRMLSIF